ncbi:MAG: SBBP repeat-containing protein [Bacteroidetes bacterium]|nr:SBBP repeat-containing protein [Bacteroidota bacterium]
MNNTKWFSLIISYRSKDLPIILLVLGFVFCAQLVQAQLTVTEEWANREDGGANANDQAFDMVVDDDEFVYVTGYLFDNGNANIGTFKYDSSGATMWSKIVNGVSNGNDWGNAIAIDASGNVYITGRIDSNLFNADIITIKYNSAGVEQWRARYNNSPYNDDDVGENILVDGSGNVYVTGKSIGNGTNWDFVTIKYNSSGVEQWVERYEGPHPNGEDIPHDMYLDGSYVYVCGESYRSAAIPNTDMVVVKYAQSNGASAWNFGGGEIAARYNGSADGFDYAENVRVDQFGNVYVFGRVNETSTFTDYCLLKYPSGGGGGTPTWVKTFDASDGPTGDGNDYGNAMEFWKDGSSYYFFVTGGSENDKVDAMNDPDPDLDVLTLKYSTAGTSLYTANSTRYDQGPGNDEGLVIAVDDHGFAYVAGTSLNNSADFDYVTIAYDTKGDTIWSRFYAGPSNLNDRPYKIVVDTAHNVYVTGRSRSPGNSNYDYLTVKYRQDNYTSALDKSPKPILETVEVYPNPASKDLFITFRNIGFQTLDVSIFNVMGNKMFSVQDPEGDMHKNFVGTSEYYISTSDYAPGMYFIRISSSNGFWTKKFLVIE